MSIRTNCRFLGRVEALEDRINLSPPTVTGVVIGDGTAQRSRVTQVAVTFSEIVTFTGNVADAISLNRTKATGEQHGVTGLVNLSASVNNSGPGSVVTLTFNAIGAKPVNSVFNSLPDGRYTLGVDSSKVSGIDGPLDGNGDGTGGDNYALISTGATGVFRMFGDLNGDSFVACNDLLIAIAAGGLGVDYAPMDYDNDGAMAASDYKQFRLRIGGELG